MKTRIRISLIVLMLMAAAGLLYAANRMFFASESFPTGMAASSTQLLVSPYCRPQVDSISASGVVTPFATIPGNVGECKERYMAISPGLGGWAPTDIYLTDGTLVYKIPTGGGVGTLFTTVPDCGYDHSGITFDHVGTTFGFDMIVTCDNGIVARINPAGTVNEFAFQAGTALEGPVVAPLTFGTFAGQILAANDDGGKVWAIKNDGTFTLAFSWAGAESVHVIPPVPCPFATTGKAFFSALQQENQVVAFPTTDFVGFGGDVIVTSETGHGITKIHWNGSGYNQMTFDTTGGGYEGSAFADCSIPSPTPTPTPTATFTPTPTPTATFTPTPTATATATSTPTPTPAGGCPLTQGYWKNHPNAWPVNSLMLGSQTYTKAELLNILNTPSGGDASLILAKQLIAAKLNIAAGSDPTPVSSTITHADSLLSMFSGKLPYHVNPSSAIGQMMVSDGDTLDNYNNGHLTPGCSGQRGQPTPRPAQSPH
jgi:hypothetical protein